jgi:hypothetical protein
MREGLTILEVLIAILLSCLVGAMLYRVFAIQDRTYSIQSEISEMQQNLRVALERITRDLTMAGFAQPPWTTINTSEVDFSGIRINGGTIDVVGSFDGAQGTLSQPAPAGSTELMLSPGEGEHFAGKAKTDISIGGRENAKITVKSGGVLTIDTDPLSPGEQGLKHAYPTGTEVYLIKWRTFWVDNSDPGQPLLRLNDHLGSGSQPLALFITNMEIALSGRMVEVTVAGRSRNPDRTTGIYATGRLSNKVVLRNLP